MLIFKRIQQFNLNWIVIVIFFEISVLNLKEELEIGYQSSLAEGFIFSFFPARKKRIPQIPHRILWSWYCSNVNSNIIQVSDNSLYFFSCFLKNYFFLFLFLFLFFLWPHAWHMEVPKLGVESELQMQAYTTATRSKQHLWPMLQLWQHWILNLLRKTRNQTCILMDTMLGS